MLASIIFRWYEIDFPTDEKIQTTLVAKENTVSRAEIVYVEEMEENLVGLRSYPGKNLAYA